MRSIWIIPVLASILILGTIGIPQTFAQLCPVTLDCVTDKIYVSDSDLNTVRQYDSDGTLLDADFVTGLSTPRGIAFDSTGNLYVVNFDTGTVRQYDSDGTLLDADFVTGLNNPVGIAFDSAGKIYVADLNLNTVLQYDSDGTLLDASFTAGNNDPQFVVFDSVGNLYVSESGPLHSVRQYDSTGTLLDANFGGAFGDTRGIAFDSTGKMYVSDNQDQSISQHDNDGTVLNANFATGNVQLAFDSPGNFYAAESSGDRIQQYDATGALLNANFITGLSAGWYFAFDTLSSDSETTGSVEILGTCGISFVSGSPIAYDDLIPDTVSGEETLTIQNTGTISSNLLVSGSDWVDATPISVMLVGTTGYSDGTGNYASKTSLTGTPAIVLSIAQYLPGVPVDTFWQVLANLIDPNFVGGLSQTMNFAVDC